MTNHDPTALTVYLAACTCAAEDSPVVSAWQTAAERDIFQVHQITTDPSEVDLILFVDPHLAPDWRLPSLLNHELVRGFGDKVLVYDERDHPWCALPGLYCSMPERYFDTRLQRACAYYGATQFAPEERTGTEPDLLFSFMGSRSHAVRNSVLRLSHPRAVVEDTSGFVFYDRSNPEAYDRQKARYLSTLLRSKFVLCPRGAGTGSIRLFETLAAGRVPVIISDRWVAPKGPDWSRFSVWAYEASVAELPRLLEAAEASYPEMAAAALAAHTQWFSQSVIFHRLVNECAGLLGQARVKQPRRQKLRRLGLGMREAKHRARSSVGRVLRATGLW